MKFKYETLIKGEKLEKVINKLNITKYRLSYIVKELVDSKICNESLTKMSENKLEEIKFILKPGEKYYDELYPLAKQNIFKNFDKRYIMENYDAILILKIAKLDEDEKYNNEGSIRCNMIGFESRNFFNKNKDIVIKFNIEGLKDYYFNKEINK